MNFNQKDPSVQYRREDRADHSRDDPVQTVRTAGEQNYGPDLVGMVPKSGRSSREM